MPHSHRHPSSSQVTLRLAFLLTLGYAAVEAIAGLWSGSLALLGDAGHMVTDALALGLASLAAWFSRRPSSSRHSYGFGRAEVVAALLNALFMLGVIAVIATEAIQRLSSPVEVNGGMVFVVAGIGLLLNLVIAYTLTRGEATLNVRGALLHVVGDLLGSVAALIAGAVIYFTHWTAIDPILALVVCVLILYSTLHLLRESLHVVMEGVPLHLDLPTVGQAMAEVEHVRSVHDLHIWTLASRRIALSAHVVIDDLGHWEEALGNLTELLHERYGIEHSTLQPESGTHVLRPMSWTPPAPDDHPDDHPDH